MQRPRLVARTAGTPPIVSFMAPFIHWIFTQGCGFPGGMVKAQPAMRN
jgi:hypothetical protein